MILILPAVALDKEYEIHQKVGQAMKDGYNKAVEIDRQYEVHQKVGEVLKNGYNKAVEMDKQYEIHQKVGSVVKSGLETVYNALVDTQKPGDQGKSQ